jgi:hypothetical protein
MLLCDNHDTIYLSFNIIFMIVLSKGGAFYKAQVGCSPSDILNNNNNSYSKPKKINWFTLISLQQSVRKPKQQ